MKKNILLTLLLVSSISYGNNTPSSPGFDLLMQRVRLANDHADTDELKKIASFSEFRSECSRLNITKEERKILATAAFFNNNPLIFEPADNLPKPDEYRINLLWIHSEKSERSENFGFSSIEDFQQRIVNPIEGWLSQQPDARITLWYDSAFYSHSPTVVHQMLMDNSRENLKEKIKENVNFSDIRPDLPDDYFWYSFHKTPIYLRVDITKLLIPSFAFKCSKTDPKCKNEIYQLVVDLDVAPITREQLFNEDSMLILKTMGALSGVLPIYRNTFANVPENCFLLVNKNVDFIFKNSATWKRETYISFENFYDEFAEKLIEDINQKADIYKQRYKNFNYEHPEYADPFAVASENEEIEDLQNIPLQTAYNFFIGDFYRILLRNVNHQETLTPLFRTPRYSCLEYRWQFCPFPVVTQASRFNRLSDDEKRKDIEMVMELRKGLATPEIMAVINQSETS